LANFFNAAFNNQIHPGLFAGLAQRPGGGPIPPVPGVHPAFSAAATTNGKSPTYAFKVSNYNKIYSKIY
jgi:hypothetical protein